VPRTNVGAAAKTSVRRIRTTEKTLKRLNSGSGDELHSDRQDVRVRRNTACRYVLSELENLADKCREEAEHVRALELQRLDDLYTKAWDLVDAGGSETAIDRCLRIMERRSKLLGLDAAEKVEHSGDLVINLRSVDMGVPDE